MKKILNISFVTAFLLGIFLLAYGVLIEPAQLTINQVTIKSEKWTYSKPLKIALLADTHAINPWMDVEHLSAIVDKINEQKPDVILLLGDYVAGHPFGHQINPDEGVQPYKNLKAACGVYAILGNHDFHGPLGWPQALAKTGIPILRNDARAVDCNDQSFWIAGLDELWWGKPSIPNTMKKITSNKPVIMMMHNPDSFPDISERITLSVAGHTHGGQIKIPFYGPVAAVIPSKYGTRFAEGHIKEDNKDLFVTRGVGNTGIPVRFNCPPEIAIISLQSQN